MWKIIEILWLLIAVSGFLVGIYLAFSEGFLAGKSYIYFFTSGFAAWRYLKARK